MKLSGLIQRDYPYVNARVQAKGAKLLRKSDYENLLKMEANEIARNLEEGDYRQEINELGSRLEGTPLVEAAIKRNAVDTLKDLIEMSPEGLGEFIKVYTRRYEIENLKKTLRAVQEDEEDHLEKKIVAPGLEYSLERLKELSEEKFDVIVRKIDFDSEIDYQSYLESSESLKEVERALDQAYFDELEKMRSETGNRKLKKLLKSELEYENLRIILRLKKYGLDESEIRKIIFTEKPKGVVEEALRAEDIDSLIAALSESGWELEGESVEDLEHSLEVSRLEKARRALRSSPLGPVPVIAYVIAKMIEIKNLKMMIQAKETGLMEKDEIRENLVMIE